MTRDGKSVSAAAASNAVVGVWSSTERPRLQVNGANTGPVADSGSGRWTCRSAASATRSSTRS